MSRTKVLLVKSHTHAPKETICEKIRVSTRVISELSFLKKKKNFEFTQFAYKLFTEVLGYFEHILIDRVVLL